MEAIKIYQGKIKHEGSSKSAVILFDFDEQKQQCNYKLELDGRQEFNLQLNPNTDIWEDSSTGVTLLSKRCGKIIEKYFD